MTNMLRVLLGTAFAIVAMSAVGVTNDKRYSLSGTSDPAAVVPKQVIAYLSNLGSPQAKNQATTNIGSLVLAVDSGPAGLLIDPLKVVLERVPKSGPPTLVVATVVSYPDPAATLSAQIEITGINPPIKGQEQLKITLNDLGCGNGSTWTAPQVWSSNNLTGQQFSSLGQSSFTTDVRCDDTPCDDGFTAIRADDAALTGTVIVDRGAHNADGTCSSTFQPTGVYVTNRLANRAGSDRRMNFNWNGIPEASFTFEAFLDPNANGAQISWKDVLGVPKFLPIVKPPISDPLVNDLSCSGPNVPVDPNIAGDWYPHSYGVLDATIPAGVTKFKVNTVVNRTVVNEVNWPTTFSTNFIVTPKTGKNATTEDLTVVSITGSNWNLAFPTTQPHSKGDLVMYTPLPRLTATSGPYVAGELANWCVIQFGTTPATPPWKSYIITGNGDPIFSGGD